MGMVSIDIEAMRSLVTSVGTAAESFRELQSSLDGHGRAVYEFPVRSATSLGLAAAWLDDQEPDLRRRLSLAEDLAAQDPSIDPSAVAIDESELSTLTPEEAAQAAEDIGDAINNTDELTEEQLQILVDNANDPYFAVALANHVDPQTLADYTAWLGFQHHTALTNPHYTGEIDPQTYQQDLIDSYESFLAGAGAAIGTATRADFPELRSDYLDDVIAVLTDDPAGNSPAALSVLLSRAPVSPEFGNAVATAVYDHERDVAEPGYWARITGGTENGFILPGGERRSDVMAGVMGMLGNSPEAAQQFFQDGPRAEVEIDGQSIEVSERLTYMLNRRWSRGHGSDEGEGVGSAWRAATTVLRGQDERGETSAELATQIFAAIAAKTGEGASDGLIWGIGADNGWEMSEQMRPHVAAMLADYAPDMFSVIGEGGQDGDLSLGYTDGYTRFPDGMPYGAVLTDEIVENLMFTLGQDAENVETVGAGWIAANQVYVNYHAQRALERDPDAAAAYLRGELPALDNAALDGATVLASLMNFAYDGKNADDAAAEARAQAMQKILSAASAIPVFKPAELLGEWGGYAFNQAKGEALNAIGGSGSAGAGVDDINNVREQAAEAAVDTYMTTLLNQGYFDESVIEKVNEETDGVALRSPFEIEGLVVTAADGSLSLDTSHPDYQDWLLDDSRISDIRQTIIAAFGLEPR